MRQVLHGSTATTERLLGVKRLEAAMRSVPDERVEVVRSVPITATRATFLGRPREVSRS
jgi:hypothetical protein